MQGNCDELQTALRQKLQIWNPGGSPGGTLFVRVGHWRVVIYKDADHPTGTSESVLPALTSLAKLAVPKLRKAG